MGIDNFFQLYQAKLNLSLEYTYNYEVRKEDFARNLKAVIKLNIPI